MRTFHVLCPTRFQGLLIVPVILITVFVFWNYGKSWPPSSSRLNLGKILYNQIELKIKDLIYKDNSYCIVLFTTRMQFGLLEQVRMLGEVK
jgi:hypothetical protein